MSETNEQQKVPSKEEVILFLQEQIEVKQLQLELQELNMKIAHSRAEEIKALQFIGEVTNPQGQQVPNGTPHVLTQEDLDEHPDLVEAGLKVGDEVIKSEVPAEKAAKQRGLKK